MNIEEARQDLFQKICWFSILLRQARLTVDCLSIADDRPVVDAPAQFLAGVPSAQQASWTSPLKEILAVQSGGQVLSSATDLVEQVNDSIEKARVSYSLTFDPPHAAHADEYHSLKLELSKPGLTAHTSIGYYDQPFYRDPLDSEIQHITVAQL